MNPMLGEAELDLGGGNEFTLVFDYEAMIVAEATYGQPLGVTSVHADQGFVGALRAMLFGATRAFHPNLTLAEATDIVFNHAPAVKAALNEAAKNSMPTTKPAEDGDGAGPPRAGTRSGGNGVKRGSTRKASSARPRARSASSSPPG